MNDIYYRLRIIVAKTPRFIIIIVLLSIIVLIPYPETITGEVTLAHFEDREVCATGQLPYNIIKKVKVGTCIQVTLDGYRIKKDGNQCGYITHINLEKKDIDKETFFSYTLLLYINPFMFKGMKGRASIELPKRNLLTRAIELIGNK